MTPSAVLCGLGGWVPPHRVSNADLSEVLDISDQWIRTRTGIQQRFVVAGGLSTSDLAVEAGTRALASAGLTDVDAVILATSTPDHPCPATAPAVAARLGLAGTPAFDVAAVCTGFIYALATATGLIGARIARDVLVIGADTFSTIVDPQDRTTRPIFGDGAGAVVLRAGKPDEAGALLGFDLGSDGSGADLIQVPLGGSRGKATGTAETDSRGRFFQMQGKQVFSHAVLRMSESSRALLEQINWARDEVDRIVAHQANIRILRAVGEHLGLQDEQIIANVGEVGNTVAASIPLALLDAASSGTLRRGHRVVLSGFGGGLTWGSTALVWPAITLQARVDAMA